MLNEAVIHRVVGGNQVMNAQIGRLAAMARRPNITVQVLPFAAGAHPGMKGPFTMLRFPEGFDDMDCVYLENENGSVWHEKPHEISRYTEVFGRLRRKSSYSGGNGECVEVSNLGAVRDSKNPAGPVLVFDQAALAAFVTKIKNG